MERLTERDEYGNADIVGVDSGELQLSLEFEEFNLVTGALNRLAEYEGTGLTPKEIEELNSRIDVLADTVNMLSPLIMENYELKKERDYWKEKADTLLKKEKDFLDEMGKDS